MNDFMGMGTARVIPAHLYAGCTFYVLILMGTYGFGAMPLPLDISCILAIGIVTLHQQWYNATSERHSTGGGTV